MRAVIGGGKDGSPSPGCVQALALHVGIPERSERAANVPAWVGNEPCMTRRARFLGGLTASAALSILALGCGGAQVGRASSSPASGLSAGALPVTLGTRLYYTSVDPRVPSEMTVAVTEADDVIAFELGCGHVEPARALASPTTGVVDARTLATGRDEYGIDRCDRPASHETGLPAFLVSRGALDSLARHQRTLFRMSSHAREVALVPVARETLRVPVDGRPVEVPVIHARGDGVELWIADQGTPLVVREVDRSTGFTLEGIETPGATAPRARP